MNNNSFTTPAFHAELYAHYCQLIEANNQPWQVKHFLKSQRDHHEREFLRLSEIHDMAQEFNMPVGDLLHLAAIVKTRMDQDENITLDFDAHRMVIKDETGVVIAWCKTKNIPSQKMIAQ